MIDVAGWDSQQPSKQAQVRHQDNGGWGQKCYV